MSGQEKFRQVYGTETEVPVAVQTGEKWSDFEPLKVTDYSRNFLSQYLPDGVKGTFEWFSNSSSSNYLSNGSRYYIDNGNILEYATPEDMSIESVILSELAGEWIIAEGVRRHIANNLQAKGGFFCIRAEAGPRKTWGYHINIGEDAKWIPDEKAVRQKTRAVLAHLATSLPMLGGGAVYQDGLGEWQYSWGQKVLSPINMDYNVATTGDRGKPIICVRQEALADSDRYWRMQISGVDPHISKWASKMLMGTISLVLLAGREGLMDDIYIQGGVNAAASAMQRATFDTELRHKFYLGESNNSHTWLDAQEKIIDRVRMTQGRTREQSEILNSWESAHAVLKNNTEDLIESDAILKKKLIEDDMDRRKVKRLDAKSRLKDLRYSAPLWATKEDAQYKSTDELLAQSYSGRVRAKYFAENTRVLGGMKDRVVHPPKTTRAHKRGKEILERSAYWRSWDYYALDTNTTNFKYVRDPFEGAIESEYKKSDDIIE